MPTDTTWINKAQAPVWTQVPTGTPSAKTPVADCCTPCPDCGGLDCLCRPRFFAGQMLTEKELNGLQSYVIAKNKLHNRYLVGAGIVCGLEATCDPCGDGVRVGTGYAISPCGEDIVVCKPDSVKICELIAACRDTDEQDCRPYAPGKDACADVIEDWVLTIRYAEAPSRSEPASGSKSSCSCGGTCGCGGSAKGGCGCSSGAPKARASVANSTDPLLRRGAPPACAPQYTCESYRYDVFRLPDPPAPPTKEDDKEHFFSKLLDGLQGPFVEKLRCCLVAIEDAIPPAITGSVDDPLFRQAGVRWICAARDNLKRFVMQRGGHDCSLIQRISALAVPDAIDAATFSPVFAESAQDVFKIAMELAIECFCSAFLPACPGEEDPRIPIAVVKVRRGTCEIISVCNWTPLRRQLVTMKTIDYWLGWLPQFAVLREYIHAACCEKFGLGLHVKGVIKEQAKADADTAGTFKPKAAVASATVQAGTFQKLFADSAFVPQSLDSTLAQKLAGMPTLQTGNGAFAMSDLAALFAAPRTKEGGIAGSAAAQTVLEALTHPLREAIPVADLAAPLGIAVPGAPDTRSEIESLRQALAAQQTRIAQLEAAARPAAQKTRKRGEK